MIFCKQKPFGICRECGVHFEPRLTIDGEQGYADLCKVHAKPFLERDRRYKNVMWYAKCNWEALEPASNEWRKTQEKAYAASTQGLAGMAAVQKGTMMDQQGTTK